MAEVEKLLAANEAYAARGDGRPTEGAPSRRVAVVTCMDCRIDPLAALGLELGEAHVIRNAGARVTGDALRSLALSTHVLGVRTVVVMQHTRCGVVGVTDDELRARTGADLDFLSIADQDAAVRADVAVLLETPYLGLVEEVAGLVYDVDTGRVSEVLRSTRT